MIEELPFFHQLHREARERVLGYLIGAFAFVAGLAWNEAVKALLEYIFPVGQGTLWAKFMYALVVTLFLVIMSVYLTRIFGSAQKKS